MVKVKVCGMTDMSLVPLLNKLTPDYVGFILTAGFRRSVSEEFVKNFSSRLSPAIRRVGVFVNDDVCRIARRVEDGIIDAVQLHGDEDGEYIQKLKNLAPVAVIKAVGVEGGRAESYPENCDMVLLDAYDKVARGGTGRRIEWRRYPEIKKPVILAGGITPENVCEAVSLVRPWGVDTSGGVERDGKKDIDKIRDYILKARECNYGK